MIEELFVNECGAQAFHPSGDEFVILLKHEVLESFKTYAKSFAKCEFEFEGELIETAMSFGNAVRQIEIDVDTLLKRADIACQAAKRQGGGSYLEWSDEIERESFLTLRNIVEPSLPVTYHVKTPSWK